MKRTDWIGGFGDPHFFVLHFEDGTRLCFGTEFYIELDRPVRITYDPDVLRKVEYPEDEVRKKEA